MSNSTKRRAVATADRPVPAPIELLFARFPALWGFSVRGLADVPDSCARTGEDGELFVSDIGVSPTVNSEQFGEMFEEITATLSEFIAEQPGGGELLRGRTFARNLH
jgi:hypothetical protein